MRSILKEDHKLDNVKRARHTKGRKVMQVSSLLPLPYV